MSDDLRAERQLTLEKDQQLLGVRKSLKTIAARFVEAFQTTDEYAKMRAKKDEPLSNIGKKAVRITGRGFPVVPVTSITPSFLGRRQRGRRLLRPPLKSFRPLPPSDFVCPRRTRRRLILACPPSEVMRDWPWTGLMGLSLLTTLKFSSGSLPKLWPAVMFTDSFR